MIEVCTVYAPRSHLPQFRNNYLGLLKWQVRTCSEFENHRHTVITDDASLVVPQGSAAIVTQLPKEFSRAMIAGVLDRLARPVDCPIVFVDVDVLIGRDLHDAFGEWELGFTRRLNALSPINNGAMYVVDAAAARIVFERALSLCGDYWGADQEAISAALAPVPKFDGIEVRDGVRVAFLSMARHNCVPKSANNRHASEPFVIHFKGNAKEWMRDYAINFLLA